MPYGDPAIVIDNNGKIIAEEFDRQSITRLPDGLPLLAGHRRDTLAAGIVIGSTTSLMGCTSRRDSSDLSRKSKGIVTVSSTASMRCLSLSAGARAVMCGAWQAPLRKCQKCCAATSNWTTSRSLITVPIAMPVSDR